MEPKLPTFILTTLCLLLITGCSTHMKFLACPSEYSSEMNKKNELGAQREVLFKADEYETLVVERNKNDKLEPVEHFRGSHTFGKIIPLKPVNWSESLHISTILIVKKTNNTLGIAIKKIKEKNWKIYWLKNRKDIVKTKGIGVLYLPPLNELEVVSKDQITN